MKTKTTFSSLFLSEIDECIFITSLNDDWQNKWAILLSNNGKPFKNMTSAINHVRLMARLGNAEFHNVGLSSLQQAQRGNAIWDNL